MVVWNDDIIKGTLNLSWECIRWRLLVGSLVHCLDHSQLYVFFANTVGESVTIMRYNNDNLHTSLIITSLSPRLISISDHFILRKPLWLVYKSSLDQHFTSFHTSLWKPLWFVYKSSLDQHFRSFHITETSLTCLCTHDFKHQVDSSLRYIYCWFTDE